MVIPLIRHLIAHRIRVVNSVVVLVEWRVRVGAAFLVDRHLVCAFPHLYLSECRLQSCEEARDDN